MGLSFPILAQNDELCDDFSIRGFKDWHLGMGEAKIIFNKTLLPIDNRNSRSYI